MSSQGPVTLVGILLFSFLVWLWCYSPGNESEIEKWLEENKFSQLKDHPSLQSKFRSGSSGCTVLSYSTDSLMSLHLFIGLRSWFMIWQYIIYYW